MKNLLSASLLLLIGNCITSCTSSPEKEAKTIELASALSNPVTLNAADYFTNVRYLPLETTDECLIGPAPDVHFIADKIIITTSQKQCLLFDVRTGKFIRTVGHRGNDPEGYNNVDIWVDTFNNCFYLGGWNNNWLKYDSEGRFVANVPQLVPAATYLAIDAHHSIAYKKGAFANVPDSLYFIQDGSVTEQIVADESEIFTPEQQISTSEIAAISVLSGENGVERFGSAGQKGALNLTYKDVDKGSIILRGTTHFWRVENESYFKTTYNDTIYQVEGQQLKPVRVFSLEKHRWPASERFNKNFNSGVLVPYILENDKLIIAQCITRLFDEEERTVYRLIYNKETSETKLSPLQKGVTDNLTNFLPFQPNALAPTGEYVCILPATDVANWFAYNPEKADRLTKEAEALRQIGEEDNPVIVFLR